MSWYVILVNSRSELSVRDELHRLKVPALVPVEVTKVHKGARTRERSRPLAPGYVFAALEWGTNWRDLSRIKGWRGPMMVAGRLSTLTQREIAAVELLSREVVPEQQTARYKPGDRVWIRRGALATLEALITRVESSGRLVADVELLGGRREVVVDEAALEVA